MKKIYFLLIALVAGSSAFAQTVANAGMETWRNGNSGTSPVVPIHAPTGWYGIDSLVVSAEETYLPIFYSGYMPTDLHTQLWQETSITHGGTSSAKLMTVKQDTLGMFAGILSNAQVNLNITAMSYSFSGGQPITGRIATVSAWVQYKAGLDSITHLPGGVDSGTLTVSIYQHLITGVDSAVGTALVKIGNTPASTWVQVTATVAYTDSLDGADTARITFASSGQAGALDSSTLYVDDITMTYSPPLAGVKNVNAAADLVKVYPNPASNMLNLSSHGNEGANFQLISVSGQVVATKVLTGKDVIDISALPAGLYIYTVTDKDNAVQRGKVTVAR